MQVLLLGLSCMLMGTAAGQSDGEHAYMVGTIGMSQTGEKMVLEGFSDQPEVVHVESTARFQRVKILTGQALTADPILQIFGNIGVQVAWIFDIGEDRYLFGSPAGGSDDLLRSVAAPSNGADAGDFKRLWLEQHPGWRRDHPPTDQDPSPSE